MLKIHIFRSIYLHSVSLFGGSLYTLWPCTDHVVMCVLDMAHFSCPLPMTSQDQQLYSNTNTTRHWRHHQHTDLASATNQRECAQMMLVIVWAQK